MVDLSLLGAGITSENIHYWGGSSFKPSLILDFQFVDNDFNCQIRQFFDFDEAVNFLFLNGFKNSARELNKLKG